MQVLWHLGSRISTVHPTSENDSVTSVPTAMSLHSVKYQGIHEDPTSENDSVTSVPTAMSLHSVKYQGIHEDLFFICHSQSLVIFIVHDMHAWALTYIEVGIS